MRQLNSVVDSAGCNPVPSGVRVRFSPVSLDIAQGCAIIQLVKTGRLSLVSNNQLYKNSISYWVNKNSVVVVSLSTQINRRIP